MKKTYQVCDTVTGDQLSEVFTMSHRAAQFRIELDDEQYARSEIVMEHVEEDSE